jgi:hypothetical protein
MRRPIRSPLLTPLRRYAQTPAERCAQSPPIPPYTLAGAFEGPHASCSEQEA